jgi:hypothetical protein
MPWGKFAILDDTCGNLIQLQQVNFTGSRQVHVLAESQSR